jgi:hypothetical protein
LSFRRAMVELRWETDIVTTEDVMIRLSGKSI